jgi:hypothetical protein
MRVAMVITTALRMMSGAAVTVWCRGHGIPPAKQLPDSVARFSATTQAARLDAHDALNPRGWWSDPVGGREDWYAGGSYKYRLNGG